MQTLNEFNVTSTSYPGTAQVDWTAATRSIPDRLKFHNAGGIAVYMSTDGTTDHDYFAAGEVTKYEINHSGAAKLWFRLASAGTSAMKVVEY